MNREDLLREFLDYLAGVGIVPAEWSVNDSYRVVPAEFLAETSRSDDELIKGFIAHLDSQQKESTT